MVVEVESSPMPEPEAQPEPQTEETAVPEIDTPEDEAAVYAVKREDSEMSDMAQSPEEAYEERIALLILRGQDGRLSRVEFERQMTALVLENAEMMFKRGAGIDKDDSLLGPERAALCLLYTSPSPRDRQKSRMPSSA